MTGKRKERDEVEVEVAEVQSCSSPVLISLSSLLRRVLGKTSPPKRPKLLGMIRRPRSNTPGGKSLSSEGTKATDIDEITEDSPEPDPPTHIILGTIRRPQTSISDDDESEEEEETPLSDQLLLDSLGSNC